MKTADLHELGGVPINKAAYRATLPGETYVPDLKNPELLFDAPPPFREREPKPGEIPPEDMKGITVGRLTVVGYWGRTGQGQQWVCRCTCGIYTVRKVRALRNANPGAMMCANCNHLEKMKNRERARQAGRWEDGTPYVPD